MPNHDTAYYMGLDKKYNGTALDYNESLHGHITAEREKIHIRYCIDGKRWLKRLVDLTEIVCIVNGMHKFNIN